MVHVHSVARERRQSVAGKGAAAIVDVVDRVVGYYYGVSGCSGKAAAINGVAREVCRSCSSAWAVDSIGVDF